VIGPVDEFYKWIEHNDVDFVFCSLSPQANKSTVDRIIRICNNRLISFYYVPMMEGYPQRSMVIDRIGNVNVIKLHDSPMSNLGGKIYRRALSFIISALFLCTIYPFIFLFVAIGIKISSPGPIYFKQKRTGYNGKDFYIYKFRSMRVNDDADTVQATENDSRKTKFGDFLRRTSIDELPQFINVFKGDMNIVGPRPHMLHHTEQYSKLLGDYMVRHLAKPGITGLAQVSGSRGETKEVKQMARRVKLDIWYIEHWSPILDIEIFFRTIKLVFSGNDKQAY